MDPKQPGEMITVQEAARTLGVSTKTIQRYLTRGLLSKVKQGARTLVRASELHALNISEGKREGHDRGRSAMSSRQQFSLDTILVGRADYEALLMELGQLRKEREIDRGVATSMEALQKRIDALEEQFAQMQTRLESTETLCSQVSRRISEEARIRAQGEGEPASTKPPKPWWQK